MLSANQDCSGTGRVGSVGLFSMYPWVQCTSPRIINLLVVSSARAYWSTRVVFEFVRACVRTHKYNQYWINTNAILPLPMSMPLPMPMPVSMSMPMLMPMHQSLSRLLFAMPLQYQYTCTYRGTEPANGELLVGFGFHGIWIPASSQQLLSIWSTRYSDSFPSHRPNQIYFIQYN